MLYYHSCAAKARVSYPFHSTLLVMSNISEGFQTERVIGDLTICSLLNQVRTWFLEIAFVWEVGMRACVYLSVSICVRPPGY